jgi:hypothetical protein
MGLYPGRGREFSLLCRFRTSSNSPPSSWVKTVGAWGRPLAHTLCRVWPFKTQWDVLYTASLNVQKFYVLHTHTRTHAHTVCCCVIRIWEQTGIVYLYSINWLFFITETVCVYCVVRTWSLYEYIILRSTHTLHLCVLYGSQNKQRLFPYTILTAWFL